jgi:chorismate-pyruvate lyase
MECPTPRSGAVNELKGTYAVLKGDLDAAVALAKEHDSQFARRTLVRTLLALVEGLTNQLAAVVAACEVRLSAEELAALREEACDLNDQGEVKTRKVRIPLKERIKVVLHCYPRIHEASFEPDLRGEGWKSLNQAIRVRNRLMHPKAEADLHVSDSDIEHVARASQWYQSTIVGLLKACQEADARIARGLSE